MDTLTLPFSYNWNNKLDCLAFTTIRLYSAQNHVPDRPVQYTLKGVLKGNGKLKGCKKFLLHEMNEYIAYLDTGYSLEEAKNIIIRMYPNVDFKTKQLALLLIVKDKAK
jgi:hypothetical protein